MKNRKKKMNYLIKDFLQDGIIEPMEKIELKQWLFELDPPPSRADIMALKRALVDTVAKDLQKNRLTISAHKAVLGVDKLVDILLSFMDINQKNEAEERAIDVHFTGLWEAVKTELLKAEKFIDIAAFSLTYNPMRDLLLEIAARKIPIRIMTEDSNLFQLGGDASTLAKHKGITIKTDGPDSLMHHKFIIIDQRIAINGSMNFTNSGIHRNDENVMVARQEDTVAMFKNEFEFLWESGLPFN